MKTTELKDVLLAGLGVASLAREAAEASLDTLIARGEQVLGRSGIPNQPLKYDVIPKESEEEAHESAPTDERG